MAPQDMEFVNQKVSEEHRRWIDELSEESDSSKDGVISIIDVLNAHFSLVDYFLENSEGEKLRISA